MHFRKGDRVRCIESHDGNLKTVNAVGTVLYEDDDPDDSVCIEFDKHIDGHNGKWVPRGHADAGKDGHCWWIHPSALVYLEANHISLKGGR